MKMLAKLAIGAVAMATAALGAPQPASAATSFGLFFGPAPRAGYDLCLRHPRFRPDFCRRPLYYGPVFIGGALFEGPFHYRIVRGHREFWHRGHWARGEVRFGPHPRPGVDFGPPHRGRR